MLIRNLSSPTTRKKANATVWSNACRKFDSVIFVIRISLGSCFKTGWTGVSINISEQSIVHTQEG